MQGQACRLQANAAMDEDAIIRKINLIQILQEDAEADGVTVPELPDSVAREWSETQVREWFAGLLQGRPADVSTRVLDAEHSAFDAPLPTDFARWFPGLASSGTAAATPRLRILCFPNAGNAEDMYTSEGTGVRRAPSPLLEWCRANSAECLAVQPPGRAMRSKDEPVTSATELAAQLLPIVASRLAETPYLVVAHSVGTWVAYELLRLARNCGLPMPRTAFLSAMASPDIADAARPWRQQRKLSEADFQEECRGWDVNEIVFSNAMWPVYHGLMRADFTMFDEYEHKHSDAQPFNFPIVAYWGAKDRKITQAMVRGWQNFTTGSFELIRIDGHHLWPLVKDAKVQWLTSIVDHLDL